MKKNTIYVSLLGALVIFSFTYVFFHEWVTYNYYSFRFIRARDSYIRTEYADRLSRNRYGLAFLMRQLSENHDPEILDSVIQGLSLRLSDAGAINQKLIIAAVSKEKNIANNVAQAIDCSQLMIRLNFKRIVDKIQKEENPEMIRDLANLLNVCTMQSFKISKEDDSSTIKGMVSSWWEDNKHFFEK